MKILLVDDDALLRDMYATKFRETGDEVTVATNADEALRILDTGPVDIVIMDMVMPQMSGVELVKAIKSRPELATVNCIVLSNQSEQADIERAKAAGALGYLIKAELIPSAVVSKVHELVPQ